MTNKPIIQNVSRQDIVDGNVMSTKDKTVLIQISDPDLCFPVPANWLTFVETHQFKFLDAEDNTRAYEPHKFSKEQAKQIGDILQAALANNQNVIVHCTAGLCRSGAVAEVGSMLGFDLTNRRRQPNIRVKSMLMSYFGWGYSNF